MTNVLVWLSIYVYGSLDLIDAVDDDGLMIFITILAVYWYICWWMTVSVIYLVIGIGMLSYYLSKCICGVRGPAVPDEDFE